MDTSAAQRAPGVLAVVTAANAGKLGKGKMNTARLLGGPEIEHYHQAVALVVAETFEQARAAAQLIAVTYAEQKGKYDLAAAKNSAIKPSEGKPDTRVGDFAGAFAAAPVQDRRHLHHARPVARHDGAACVPCFMERRPVDDLDLEPDDRLEPRRRGLDPGHSESEGTPDFAVYRRRLRRQAVRARRCRPGRARCARRAAPRQGGVDASATDEQHHAPARHHPAPAPRRHARRQDHGHRP